MDKLKGELYEEDFQQILETDDDYKIEKSRKLSRVQGEKNILVNENDRPTTILTRGPPVYSVCNCRHD